MTRILAYLSAEITDHIEAWLVDDDGATTSASFTYEQITDAKATEVVAVVPTSLISWHMIDAPPQVLKGHHKQKSQVLFSILEDQILATEEEVHLSFDQRSNNGQILVAVCSKSWLGQWVKTLENANISISRIVPEITPEISPEHAICSGSSINAWFSFQDESVLVTLSLIPENSNFTKNKIAFALPQYFEDAVQVFGADNVKLDSLENRTEQLLRSTWNLAQGEFATSASIKFKRKAVNFYKEFLYERPWKSARYACLTLCALLVICANVENYLSQSSLQDKREAITRVVTNTFPNIKYVIDPNKQMQREVAAMKTKVGMQTTDDFMPMVTAVGKAINSIAQRPSSIEYRQGELDLIGMDLQAAKSIDSALSDTSYAAIALPKLNLIRVTVRK